MTRPRVLVVDDHEVVRRGICALLDAASFDVCGEAADGEGAIERTRALSPDVVVLDLAMPGMSGLAAARRIVDESPRTEVLILTMHESDQLVRDVLAAGARAYVLKSDAGRDLVAAVHSLAEHRPYLTPRVAELVVDGYLRAADRSVAPSAETASRERLTPREREVVRLVAEGLSSRQVAERLGISVKTVETHRSNILRRLGVESVGELVRWAVRAGLVEP